MRLRLPCVRSKRLAWLVSLSGSMVFHLTLLTGTLLLLLSFSIPEKLPVISTDRGPFTYEGEWTLRSQFDSIDVLSGQGTPEQDRSPEVNEGTTGLSALIQERLQDEQQKLAGETPEELKKKLELMGTRLQAASSETGVDEITTMLQGVLGVPAGAESAAESLGEERNFDFNNAQIDDVRLETVDGLPRYMATMVDSRGTSLDVELDEPDGAQLYEVFELMRKYPLMKSVYRGVVMGLLDKMTRKPATPGGPESLDDTQVLPLP